MGGGLDIGPNFSDLRMSEDEEMGDEGSNISEVRCPFCVAVEKQDYHCFLEHAIHIVASQWDLRNNEMAEKLREAEENYRGLVEKHKKDLRNNEMAEKLRELEENYEGLVKRFEESPKVLKKQEQQRLILHLQSSHTALAEKNTMLESELAQVKEHASSTVAKLQEFEQTCLQLQQNWQSMEEKMSNLEDENHVFRQKTLNVSPMSNQTEFVKPFLNEGDVNVTLPYWLSNTSALLCLLQKNLRSNGFLTAGSAGSTGLNARLAQFAGTSWHEPNYIRQAVGLLVIHGKRKISLEDIRQDLCPKLTMRQINRISTMYWDDKYGTKSVPDEVVSRMMEIVLKDSQNLSSSNSFILDNDLSIPFFTEDGRPCTYGLVSSIGSGFRQHFPHLLKGARWIVGLHSRVSFWHDNWLGYVISERIGLPRYFASTLRATVGDFFFDDCWHFEECFVLMFTEIIKDILSIKVFRGPDLMVWTDSVSGELAFCVSPDT